VRYTLKSVAGPARRLFKDDVAYDDREIVRLARREGLYVTRPNGSQRIRGSSRLQVWHGNRIVARFERQTLPEAKVENPTPVATIRGRLI